MSVSDGLLSGDTFAYLDSLRNVMAKDAEARLQETNRLKSTIAEMEMRCKGLEEQLLVKEGQLKIKDEEYASLAAQVKSLNEAQRATKIELLKSKEDLHDALGRLGRSEIKNHQLKTQEALVIEKVNALQRILSSPAGGSSCSSSSPTHMFTPQPVPRSSEPARFGLTPAVWNEDSTPSSSHAGTAPSTPRREREVRQVATPPTTPATTHSSPALSEPPFQPPTQQELPPLTQASETDQSTNSETPADAPTPSGLASTSNPPVQNPKHAEREATPTLPPKTIAETPLPVKKRKAPPTPPIESRVTRRSSEEDPQKPSTPPPAKKAKRSNDDSDSDSDDEDSPFTKSEDYLIYQSHLSRVPKPGQWLAREEFVGRTFRIALGPQSRESDHVVKVLKTETTKHAEGYKIASSTTRGGLTLGGAPQILPRHPDPRGLLERQCQGRCVVIKGFHIGAFVRLIGVKGKIQQGGNAMFVVAEVKPDPGGWKTVADRETGEIWEIESTALSLSQMSGDYRHNRKLDEKLWKGLFKG